MAVFILFCSLIAFNIFLYALHKLVRCNGKKLPPGPIGLPLVGSLFNLNRAKPIYKSFADLAKIYGPIMTVSLGATTNIIISNSEMAKEVLKKYDHVLASRPPNMISNVFNAAGYNIVWAPLGSEWMLARKVTNSELLSASSLGKFKEARLAVIDDVIRRIQGDQNVCIVLRKYLWDFAMNSMAEMVLGKHYENNDHEAEEIKRINDDFLRLTSLFDVEEFLPFLSKVNLLGSQKFIRQIKARMSAFINRLVFYQGQCKHKQGFLYSLLRLKGDYNMNYETVENIAWDLIGAGTDTIVSSTEWAMAELLLHPDKMAKAKQEIDNIVQSNKLVNEDDLERLTYIHYICKETLRLHPPAPMMLPHCGTEKCNIAGYEIPLKAKIHVNLFAIHRDHEIWGDDADQFLPERFENEDVDMRGSDFKLLPFGSGRRQCPGMRYGIVMMTLIVANLIHKFDFSLPQGTNPSDVDMREAFGISQSMRTPISCCIHGRW